MNSKISPPLSGKTPTRNCSFSSHNAWCPLTTVHVIMTSLCSESDCQAAVHADYLACDVRRIRPGQEVEHTRYFLRLPGPSHRQVVAHYVVLLEPLAVQFT